MLMRDKIRKIIQDAAGNPEVIFDISYPDSSFGDYATNIALVLSKQLKQKPQDAAQNLIEKMDQSMFESVSVAGPGFINFKLKTSAILNTESKLESKFTSKILLEYFQPNIAKPLHIGHLETAIIGDALKRMLLFAGEQVESDTHMGDWGTQFGYLILVYKKFGQVDEKLYAQLNADAATDPSIHDAAKQEFAK